MSIPWLFEHTKLPSPDEANHEGVVAVGGELSVKRLIEAYGKGIFPWPHEDLPLLWFSPDPRFVIPLTQARVPRSLIKHLKKTTWRVTFDQDFENVIMQCALISRPEQGGTWITAEMANHYIKLHDAGFAHSVEVWDDDKLIGGFYGVSLGQCFFGESMFALEPDASKIGFATFIAQLSHWNFDLIDCQVHTDHLERFGAVFWSREDYCLTILKSQEQESLKAPWKMTLTPQDAYSFFKKRDA
jgi:leucyl/phenylalanyl-tRNA---protein transferase